MPRWFLFALAVAASVCLVGLDAQQRQPLNLSQLTWFDRGGRMLGTLGTLADHGNIELSPDGARVASAITDQTRGTRDIWVYDVATTNRARFTTGTADENWLIWSSDGRQVVFNSFDNEMLTLFETPSSRDEPRRPLMNDMMGKWPVSWSADGRYLLYVTSDRRTGNDIWVLPLATPDRPYPFQRTMASENWAAFSPDGRWVAFSSTESGDTEVYVSRFGDAAAKRRISTNGGTQARWRQPGEILYLDRDRQLVSASVQVVGDHVEQTRAERLFLFKYPYGAYHAFDITPDAQRVLANVSVVSPDAPAVIARR